MKRVEIDVDGLDLAVVIDHDAKGLALVTLVTHGGALRATHGTDHDPEFELRPLGEVGNEGEEPCDICGREWDPADPDAGEWGVHCDGEYRGISTCSDACDKALEEHGLDKAKEIRAGVR